MESVLRASGETEGMFLESENNAAAINRARAGYPPSSRDSARRSKADDQFAADGGRISRSLYRCEQFFLPAAPCGSMACRVAPIRVREQEKPKRSGFAVMCRRRERPCHGRNGRMERKQEPQVALGKQNREQLLLHGRGTIFEKEQSRSDATSPRSGKCFGKIRAQKKFLYRERIVGFHARAQDAENRF